MKWLLIALLLPLTALGVPTPDELLACAPGLRRPVLEAALRAQRHALSRGETPGDRLAVIDYSLPSTERRLWVFDLQAGTLLFHELVTHGRGSGELHARAFSNRENSHQTSLGVFVARETYQGTHGYSLRLDGLERGVNHKARERAIVVHAADYATEDFARRAGRLGLSWGCPAVAPQVARPLIDTLREGALLVAWYPDEGWLSTSDYVAAR